MPALTWFYGLRPWEIERLTMDEVDAYLGQLDEYERETAKRNDGG